MSNMHALPIVHSVIVVVGAAVLLNVPVNCKSFIFIEECATTAQWFKTIGDDDIFEPLINIYIIPSLYRYDVI